MKILSAEQIRAADEYTITHEPVSSIDLMERASQAFVAAFCEYYAVDREVYIFCGVGNNGGDGLAIGRLLTDQNYRVSAWIVGDESRASMDFKMNRLRVKYDIQTLREADQLPSWDDEPVIIDALFGSGLNRPLEGLPKSVVYQLNDSKCEIVSVDIASGLAADRNLEASLAIKPTRTISFQVPKLAFFQPSLSLHVGLWEILDIGLHQNFLEQQVTKFELTTSQHLQLSQRDTFMHKGNAGRVQLWVGAKGKMGAGILAARACLRAGVGLLFVKAPACGTAILQQSVIEAMVTEDQGTDKIVSPEYQADADVIGIGPGLGTDVETMEAFGKFLKAFDGQSPLILDADAINLLATDPGLIKLLPVGSILTPHPGEFKRLVGAWSDDFDKLEKLRSFCQAHQVHVVLKGAFSAVCDTSGQVYFNPTGNPGMATAGSGDVLFGIICGLLAQTKDPFFSLRAGVYLHGLAGDFAKQDVGVRSLIASDLIKYLPEAILSLER